MKSIPSSAVVLFLCVGLVSANDEPAKVRSADEVKKKLVEILASPREGAGEREAALRRLKAYRYLAGVPYDITLDDEFNAACETGAKLCAKLGRLDHTPANPGLPEDDFTLGYKGTSQSNLGQGYRGLEDALDGWIEDSDKNNISHVGHRRWCFNPAMQKTGSVAAASSRRCTHSTTAARRCPTTTS